MNVIEHDRTIKHQIPLHWRRSNDPFPTDCRGSSIRDATRRRTEYAEQLPVRYIGNFFYGDERTIIIRDGNDELFLFLSFKEGQSVYVISSLNRGISQDDKDFLSLSFNTEYKIQLKFRSDKHDNLAEKIFKFRALSWDNIQLNII